MWFVLEMGTEKTVAICHFEDAANIIAETFPAKCIVRYCEMSNAVYSKDAKFFENSEEMKKGA